MSTVTTQGKRVQKKKPGSPVWQRVLRYAYRTLVVISAIIVAVYVGVVLAIREPEMAAPPTAGVDTPTDDPNTEIDESQLTPDPGPVHERRKQVYTFLLAATDATGGNTDTIMVVTYDVPNQSVGMVSIPRDTLVNREVNGHSYIKINAANSYGGMDELKAAVTDLLGIPIDYTVRVNLNGFIRLVDAVGGIDFQVPVHMSYDDPTQNLHIHYEPQMYYGLTGQQVMEIARCRQNNDGDPNVNGGYYAAYPDSDIGRTRTQQQLLMAIGKKMLSWGSLTRINEYIEIANENVTTNLTINDMLWFASKAYQSVDLPNNITTATLEGNGAVSYKGASVYQLYPDKTLETVNTILNPYEEDLELEELNIFQKPAA